MYLGKFISLLIPVCIQLQQGECSLFNWCGKMNPFKGSPYITDDLVVMTVASEATDGYLRYLKSAEYNGIPITTLGMNKKWQGGNMAYPGGAYKLRLLREALHEWKNEPKLVLFTDSYDVIIQSDAVEIITKFKRMNAGILFSAEHFCWPDLLLKNAYPNVGDREARYLNSGMFMGSAQDIYKLLDTPFEDSDDDQLILTKQYLNESLRNEMNLMLDHKSLVFQNLNGASSDVRLEFDDKGEKMGLLNSVFNHKPAIIHGNGNSKLALNYFGNYLNEENNPSFSEVDTSPIKENLNYDFLLAVFIEEPMPFLSDFFAKTLRIKFPYKRTHLLAYNGVSAHNGPFEQFVNDARTIFKSTKIISSLDNIGSHSARDLAVKYAITKKVDYMLMISGDAHVNEENLVSLLIAENRSIVAPKLTRQNELWSNYWGAVSDTGFYARSNDYLDIATGKIRGSFNVPFMSSVYLVKKNIFPVMTYQFENLDSDMAFCQHMRWANIFMFITNKREYGYLINNENYDANLSKPEFNMLSTNPLSWEAKYIHPEYREQLNADVVPAEPCPDVYWFPIGKPIFCEEMIAIMENFGKWSDGGSSDTRLEGGYEAVPTRDIHMSQVGLDDTWLLFLKLFIRPLQEKVFTGYIHNPPRSLMNFVVRYRPDEQPSLRPHHDSSTYTINIALNRAGIDYEGGGCRFVRYNCSVQDTKQGWLLMHPGRLTHFHEGLTTTAGTRYIMVSFVDP